MIFARVKFTHCIIDPFPVSEVKGSHRIDSLLLIYVEIINLCITSTRFPASEKKAIVKPIVKGNMDPHCLSSYRPVSNLSFLSKMIESVILKQLIEFLTAVNVLPDEQSAYRKLYSTESALVSVINDLILTMDEGRCGVLILLDLSAAFDTVVHELLFEDLRAAGVSGEALGLLIDYLSNRRYCVQVGDSL